MNSVENKQENQCQKLSFFMFTLPKKNKKLHSNLFAPPNCGEQKFCYIKQGLIQPCQ